MTIVVYIMDNSKRTLWAGEDCIDHDQEDVARFNGTSWIWDLIHILFPELNQIEYRDLEPGEYDDDGFEYPIRVTKDYGLQYLFPGILTNRLLRVKEFIDNEYLKDVNDRELKESEFNKYKEFVEKYQSNPQQYEIHISY